MSWTERFDFFTASTCSLGWKDEGKDGRRVSCAVRCREQLVIGDSSGYIHLYSLRDLRRNPSSSPTSFSAEPSSERKRLPFYSFQLYEKSIFFSRRVLSKASTIVFIGAENASTQSYTLKAYDLDKGANKFLYSFSLDQYVPLHVKIDLFEVSSSGQQMALALSNGSLVLVTINNFIAASSSSEIITSGRMLVPPQPAFVSNLFICDLPYPSEAEDQPMRRFETRLFVTFNTTEGSAFAVHATHQASDQMGIAIFTVDPKLILSLKSDIPVLILDEIRGVDRYCASLMRSSCELLVGQDEGLFTYSIEEIGSALGLEGKKKGVMALRMYTLIVDEVVLSVKPKSMALQITVYHLKRRWVCARLTLARGESVLFVGVNDEEESLENSAFHIITSSRRLIILRENDLIMRVSSFVGSNDFHTALAVAAESQTNPAVMADIFTLFGDALYAQGKAVEAFEQYRFSLGSPAVSISSLIQKFLPAVHRHILLQLLMTLLEKDLANSEHMNIFIQSCVSNMSLSSEQLNYIVRTCSLYADRFISIGGNSLELVDELVKSGHVPEAFVLSKSFCLYEKGLKLSLLIYGIQSLEFQREARTICEKLTVEELKSFLRNWTEKNALNSLQLLLFLTSSDLQQPPLLSFDQCTSCLPLPASRDFVLSYFDSSAAEDLETLSPHSTLLYLDSLLCSHRDKEGDGEEKKTELNSKILRLLATASSFKSEALREEALILLKHFKFNYSGMLLLLERGGPMTRSRQLSILKFNRDKEGILALIQRDGNSSTLTSQALEALIDISIEMKNVCRKEERDMEGIDSSGDWDDLKRLIKIISAKRLLPLSQVTTTVGPYNIF